MARKPDISAYKNFDQIVTRMEEIVGQVRDKDTSLERSLDLFDEALSLGSKAVGLVDTTDFSPAELERMKDVEVGGQEADASQSSDTPAKEA
ncbi:MAG: exodeoxyribonuclease VII small subunit [Atopobiaceae bacterium]|nr:exodeoxyribonuclease VII small subunit [Atopobiaceae bacterium]